MIIATIGTPIIAVPTIEIVLMAIVFGLLCLTAIALVRVLVTRGWQVIAKRRHRVAQRLERIEQRLDQLK